MPKRLNIDPGTVFGRLTIIKEIPWPKGRRFLCRCTCDRETTVSLGNLTSGAVKSCDLTGNHKISHWKLHSVWRGMKNRCHSPNFKTSNRYGKRGIIVCDEWRYDFWAFYNWAMWNGYQEGLDVDRRDNNGNYTPENCRFVTRLIN